jgi:hypothetical protein
LLNVNVDRISDIVVEDRKPTQIPEMFDVGAAARVEIIEASY